MDRAGLRPCVGGRCSGSLIVRAGVGDQGAGRAVRWACAVVITSVHGQAGSILSRRHRAVRTIRPPLLRPDTAGSNTTADHVTVFDAALAQIPAPLRRE